MRDRFPRKFPGRALLWCAAAVICLCAETAPLAAQTQSTGGIKAEQGNAAPAKNPKIRNNKKKKAAKRKKSGKKAASDYIFKATSLPQSYTFDKKANPIIKKPGKKRKAAARKKSGGGKPAEKAAPQQTAPEPMYEETDAASFQNDYDRQQNDPRNSSQYGPMGGPNEEEDEP